jgi:hypothetical protein
MNEIKSALEKYSRLDLSKEELLKQLDQKKHNDAEPFVVVTIDEVKNIIKAGLENRLNKGDFSDWIDFIWFSGYYKYEEENQEMIAQIMNDLEDVEQLSDEEYLNLLDKINTRILQDYYPKE